MQTTLLVARNATPFVTPQEVAEHCRVTDEGEFGLLASIAEVAVAAVEDYTGLALTQNRYRWHSDSWPAAGQEIYPWYGRRPAVPRRAVLRRSPLISVEAVKYYDDEGAQVTVNPSNYYADTVSPESGVVFKGSFSYPELVEDWRADRVTIDFTAGGGCIDPRARQAVLLLCSHYYDNQGAVAPVALSEIPFSLQSLLTAIRI